MTSGALFSSNAAYLEADLSWLREALDAFEGDGALLLSDRDALRARRRDAMAAGVPIPLEMLAEAYGLGPAEELALLIAATEHLSHPLWRRLVALDPTPGPGIGQGLLSALLGGGGALLTQHPALSLDGVLVTGGLMDNDGARVRVPQHVALAILGVRSLDAALREHCELYEPTRSLVDVALSSSARELANELLRVFRARDGGVGLTRRSWVLAVGGPAGVGKSALADALVASLQRMTLRVRCGLLTSDIPRLLRLAFRNAQLLGAVLHLEHPEVMLEHHAEYEALLAALVADFNGLVVVEGDAGVLREQLCYRIDLTAPGPEERLVLWEAAVRHPVAADSGIDLDELAAVPMTGPAIRLAVDWALQLALSRRQGAFTQADLLESIRVQQQARSPRVSGD